VYERSAPSQGVARDFTFLRWQRQGLKRRARWLALSHSNGGGPGTPFRTPPRARALREVSRLGRSRLDWAPQVLSTSATDRARSPDLDGESGRCSQPRSATMVQAPCSVRPCRCFVTSLCASRRASCALPTFWLLALTRQTSRLSVGQSRHIVCWRAAISNVTEPRVGNAEAQGIAAGSIATLSSSPAGSSSRLSGGSKER
jgi:hypothetical protein